MKKEVQLVENKELREQMISKVEVLDKVKKIITLPNTDFMTTEQVAEYYEVNIETVKQIINRNKDELLTDGFNTFKKDEVVNFLKVQNVHLKNIIGKSIIILNNGQKIEIPNRGLRLFTKRALLRVGMLLRDSDIAKEIRNRLLDIIQDTEEKAPEIIQQVVTEIDIEQQLVLEVGKAIALGDVIKLSDAVTRLIGFKNEMHAKRVKQLENDNKALAQGILLWQDRSKLNYGIRRLASKSSMQVGQLWNEFYRQLLYKYHIHLKARGDRPWLQYIKEDEWENVIKCFSALCEFYKQSPTLILNELEVA